MTKLTSKIVTALAILGLGTTALAATTGDQGAAAEKPATEKKVEKKVEVKKTTKHHAKHASTKQEGTAKSEAAAPAPAAPAAPATK